MNRAQRRATRKTITTDKPAPADPDLILARLKSTGKGKVVIGYCSPYEVGASFHNSILNSYDFDRWNDLGRFDHESWRIHNRSGSGSIDKARNQIVAEFLQLDYEPEWLWMVDADMRWDPDAVEALIAAADPVEHPIVGGLCLAYGKKGTVIPTVFDAHPETGAFLPTERTAAEIMDGPPRLIECGTGAAFLMIHRSALIRIGEHVGGPHAWFRIAYPAEDWRVSEDFFFCHAAFDAGLSVAVHTGVRVDHEKPHFLRPEIWRAGQYDEGVVHP